jgi:methyl-accepting chemotaxis protein
MKPSILPQKLGAKFLLASALLFLAAGAATFLYARHTTNVIIDLYDEVVLKSAGKADAIGKELEVSYGAIKARKLELAKISAALNESQRRSEIEQEKAYVRGKFEGSLRIIGSQLEGILAPMPSEDREMFMLDASGYTEALKSAREINFFAIWDEETANTVIEDEGFDADRAQHVLQALKENATAANPKIIINKAEQYIRILAFIGPDTGRFGVLEVVSEDIVTPLNIALETVRAEFAQKYREESATLETAFQAERAAILEGRDAAAEQRNARSRQATQVVSNARMLMGLAIALTAIVGAAVIGFLVSWLITKPLGGMVVVMRKLAGGELEILNPAIGRRDEIGEIAQSLETFRENSIERERLRVLQESARTQAQEKAEKLATLIAGFEETIGSVSQAVSGSASQLGEAAGTLRDNTQSAQAEAARATDSSKAAAENAGAVVQSTDELSAAISGVTNEVSESGKVSEDALQQAQTMEVQIDQLSRAAQEVESIITLIQDIAQQTNLLALNATIEAARAGDAGKGFAVVANEVKNLAGQTAKATEEITSQINSIQTATQSSVVSIKAIAATVGEFGHLSTKIDAAVSVQQQATETIRDHTDTASRVSNDVLENLEEIVGAIGSTNDTAEHVSEISESLQNGAQSLEREVGQFLNSVREA